MSTFSVSAPLPAAAAALLLLLSLSSVPGAAAAKRQAVAIDYDAGEAAVTAACDAVEEWFGGDEPAECSTTYTSGCDVRSLPGVTCDPLFGTTDTGGCGCSGAPGKADVAITMIAPNSDSAEVDADVCRTDRASRTLTDIGGQYNLTSLWTGYQSGVHKSWPARDWRVQQNPNDENDPCRVDGPCPEFDPRVRRWYVAAATGPKNVILVLDTSGSMVNSDRIGLAKDAATAVVNTLTFADYFGVVEYNTDARSWREQLEPANAQSREDALDFIDSLSPSGGTNMEAGFNKAFDLIGAGAKAGDSPSCATVILFLTDGIVSDGASGGALVSAVNDRNDVDTNAFIFTYALGADAEGATLKDIACENSGQFQDVEDGGELGTVMSRYYSFLAVGGESSGVVWSEPYLDAVSGLLSTSPAKACYDRSGKAPVLIGAAGSGLVLGPAGSTVDQATLDELLRRSSKCNTVTLSTEQLEVLRGDDRCYLTTGEIIAIVLGITIPLLLCAAIGGVVFYRKTKKDNEERAREQSEREAEERRRAEQEEERAAAAAAASTKSPSSRRASSSKSPSSRRKSSRRRRSPSPSSSSSSSSSESSSESSSVSSVSSSSTSSATAGLGEEEMCKNCNRRPPAVLLSPCSHGVCANCGPKMNGSLCPTCGVLSTGTVSF